MNQVPLQLSAFDMTVRLLWQKIPIPDNGQQSHVCEHNQFYLNIPGVVRFLALAEEQCIIIEPAHNEFDMQILNSWLQGTVMAYLLQYHGYTVLHGSAVRIHDAAVIISGPSGAGKSTLASALVHKGHTFITDDLVVIKPDKQGRYCILPGPAKLKLWKDAIIHFDYNLQKTLPVAFKIDKYAIPVTDVCNKMIPITAFYELNMKQDAKTFTCERQQSSKALKILMQNAYRYFMLQPLGKLPKFFQDCSALLKQISVSTITRSTNFNDLPRIIEQIESDHNNTLNIGSSCFIYNEPLE